MTDPTVATPDPADAPPDPARAPIQASKLPLVDWLLFALTRLAGVKVSIAETRNEKYPTTTATPAYRVDPKHAEFLFKIEREDSAYTDDKVKLLLTLSSSLAAIILVFARDVSPRFFVVIVLALLVAAVFLCVGVFRVQTVNLPTVEEADSSGRDAVWSADLMKSYAENEARHAFRVDRYRAAGRYFQLALLLTPVAAAFTSPRPDPAAGVISSLSRIDTTIQRFRVSVDSLWQQDIALEQPRQMGSNQSVPRRGRANRDSARTGQVGKAPQSKRDSQSVYQPRKP
jgi:hypothetical protein